jgi:hypothetical protein
MHLHYRARKKKVSANGYMKKTFYVEFMDAYPKVVIELTNASEKTLNSIVILTIFLKDIETARYGRSHATIRFDGVKSMQPGEKKLLSHRTWIDGKPAEPDQDQMERLRLIARDANPYALEISWMEAEGKMRFERIPFGS